MKTTLQLLVLLLLLSCNKKLEINEQKSVKTKKEVLSDSVNQQKVKEGKIDIETNSNTTKEKSTTILNFLNLNQSYPFQTEKNIEGHSFISLSDTFNYYQNPIIINDIKGRAIVKIVVSDNEVITTYKNKSYSRNDTLNPFSPWLISLNPDYFRLALDCIDSTSENYKVKLNNKDYGYINKKSSNFKIEKVNDFVKNWLDLGFDFNRNTNPLRKEPNENSEIIRSPFNLDYKIWSGSFLKIDGNWLKIKTIKDEIGWIKWKRKNKVLIRMYFVC